MITAMDEHLVGYLLKALDPDTQREVEAYVRGEPEAARKLELLRQALEPLAGDRETPLPPPGLRLRTLARIAEYRCRDLPRVLPAPPIRSRPPERSWWRRADVLVAAALLLVLLPLVPPGLNRLRQQRDILDCQNNLRNVYLSLVGYSSRHNGALPRVEEEPPRNVAGIFVPILRDAGLLTQDVSVGCPAKGRHPPPSISLQQLAEVAAEDQQRFMEYARQLAGCYAYTLGYRKDGNLCGLRFDPDQGNEYVPILADRPPFEQKNYLNTDAWENSPNHNGAGQNVLYLSGHVNFFRNRTVGVDGKDIFLNREMRPEAGLDRWDSVLGASGFHPSVAQATGD
jgi:hypothetical protein